MFQKVLIANRGEIACRIMETAHLLGVATVAVYSDADAAAKHVALADEAVRIGPAPVAESYLLGGVIIEAALATGAEAIHPGYGFLSENPDFVDAVEAAGLVFIGPSAKAIRAMGLKDASKRLMEEAGVPVVPGYHGKRQEDAFLAGCAEEIGYPVLIKAVAGGGGKGMRRVDRPGDFAAALASARGEAKTAFGNTDVLIEKYVLAPRHIEIQVFGDNHGNAVHLFERDCSLQRRHQKVIEEAPAPGMTEEMRAAMGHAAVQAARAIGYSGAGTVEFIVDGSDGLRTDRFWFMEMNTRLQVEHPVTEAITGVDLVEWQLRVASGEALPRQQGDLSIRGHAFEARLYAEDASRGFLPAIGTLSHLRFPEGVRADSGIRAGDAISPFYDPMIAKVIVHGPTRGTALNALCHALAGTRVAGSVTNLSFLARLAGQQDFAAGRVDTGLIERHLEALTGTAVSGPAVVVAAMLASEGLGQNGEGLRGFHIWAPLTRLAHLAQGDETVQALITCLGPDRFDVTYAGEKCRVADVVWKGAQISFSLNGVAGRLEVLSAGSRITVYDGAEAHIFGQLDPLAIAVDAGAGGDHLIAPMPGLVKALGVAAGEAVAQGDVMMVLEAMKMEHALTAPRDGVIAEVLVAEGAQVADGTLLLTLEPLDD